LALSGLGRVFTTEVALQRAAYGAVVAGVLGMVHLAATTSTGRSCLTVAKARAKLAARIGERGYGWFEVANLVHLRDTVAAAELDDVVTAIRAKEPERELLLFSGQAGFVPYHLFQKHPKGVRFLDAFSLVTRDFLQCLGKDELRRTPAGLSLSFRQ